MIQQSNKINHKAIGVDVVIPVYNGALFIIQAIASVEKQTYPAKKIIVVNDGSTDNTREIIQKYHSKIPLEYIHQQNKGLSSARNTGIRQSQSEYIALLDADDEWYPSKLEDQLHVFQTSSLSYLGIVFSQCHIIDGRGILIDKHFIFSIDPDIRGWVFEKLLSTNKVVGSGSGVLIRRICFEKVGLFDENLSACEDWDMWLRIAQEYEFDYVDKALVKIRRHDQNMQKDDSHMFRNRVIFYNKWALALVEQHTVPPYWIKVAMCDILNRLPKTDFMKILRTSLSPQTKKKFLYTIQRELKWYTFLKLVLFPFIFISKIIHSSIKKSN